MTYLLDTTVVSELRRPRVNPNVAAWFTATRESDWYLSVLVLGELRRGVELLRPHDPRQAAVYEAALEELRRVSAGRVLPVTTEIAEEWGRIDARSPVSTTDGLMAATAKVHGLTLVTRNTRDLIHTGVRLLNPFEPG